jgi:hypothetical protein
MINIDQLRHDIEALIRNYPDLNEDEVLRHDMLDAETDMYSALTALVGASSAARANAEAITTRIDALGVRRARFRRRFDALRELMLKVLQSADLKKIELPDATLFQRAGEQQIVGEPDPATLPDDLCVIERKANRAAIKQALLEHREIPGLTLSNAAPSLTVRVK